MKITKLRKVSKDESFYEYVTVNDLVNFLNDKYIKTGKGNTKIRTNLPGQGWVYTSDVSDVFGEPYIGLSIAEAEEMELAAQDSVDEKEKEIEVKPKENTKESK